MECPSIKIIWVSKNIFVIEKESDYGEVYVEVVKPDPKIKDPQKQEVEVLREVLHQVLEACGGHGGKHDAHRVYIVDRPGENHPTFTKKDSEVLWGDPKDASIELFEEEDEDSSE